MDDDRADRKDWTIRKYTDFDEIKADEYRYWQSRPAHERLDAIEELNEIAYALKGLKIPARMDRTYVRRLKWVGTEEQEIPFPESENDPEK